MTGIEGILLSVKKIVIYALKYVLIYMFSYGLYILFNKICWVNLRMVYNKNYSYWTSAENLLAVPKHIKIWLI